MKKAIALTLLAAQFTALLSCGGETPAETTAPETTTAPEEVGYPYPDEGFGGEEFVVFNADKQFGCNIRVNIEEQSGEALDDAIYLRNRKVEDKLDITISEFEFDGDSAWGTSQANMCNHIATTVMAGDDIYDAAYLPVYYSSGVITSGSLVDLKTVPELKLDEYYWDEVINDALIINNKLYTASGPLHLMSLDLAWILLFNEDMMDDMGITPPYDLVREGKWTLDAFNAAITGVANLNGDESFKWNADGNALYAIANHMTSPEAFIFSAGNKLMTREGDSFKFTAATERMYDTIDKLAVTLSSKNGNVYSDNGSDLAAKMGYMYAFMNNRSLYMTAELKTTLQMRSMKSTFGIVPMPKYDESQENYITYANPITCLLTIPATNQNLARTGLILDALTYESYNSILPVYYDITLSQKGLRNEDSIEMLEIIRSTRGIVVSDVFGITNSLSVNLATNAVLNATGNAASMIASASATIEGKLADLMAAFE